MYRSRKSKLWLAFCGVVLMAVLAQAAERLQMLAGLRVAMQDALSPGRLIVAALTNPDSTSQEAKTALPEQQSTESHIQLLEQQRRRLLIENAHLNNKLRLHRMAQAASVRYRPLAEFDLISARVLSHSGMPTALLPAMIDVGKAHGMTRSELVLDAKGILLDQGLQDGIATDRPVLTGSVVVGRIERTGRWVSQLVPISDPSFSAQVRLVHRSPHGTHLGEEGMLEGTGTGCRITGLPDTASVSVGDAVVSENIEGLVGPPLYYGTVAEATFQSAGEWAVGVKPAIALEDLNRVVVVVPKLNVARIAPAIQQTAQRNSQ